MWKRTSTDLRHVVARPAAPCRAVRAVPARPTVDGQWPAADRRFPWFTFSQMLKSHDFLVQLVKSHDFSCFNHVQSLFFLNCCSRRCPNVHDANIPMAWGTAKSGAAASMHSEWMGFLGKNYRTPPYFMENPWFPVRIFPIKPVHWANIANNHHSIESIVEPVHGELLWSCIRIESIYISISDAMPYSYN